MKVVYLAGPFRGVSHWDIWENIMRAAALSLEVWRLGAACVCPHMNSFCFQEAAPDHVWLDGDLEILRRCDALLMTPDWEKSTGARAEHDAAVARNQPVFYSLHQLKEWLGTTP